MKWEINNLFEKNGTISANEFSSIYVSDIFTLYVNFFI